MWAASNKAKATEVERQHSTHKGLEWKSGWRNGHRLTTHLTAHNREEDIPASISPNTGYQLTNNGPYSHLAALALGEERETPLPSCSWPGSAPQFS